jgi:polar amino acid transport system substrate-binding protein
MNHRRFFIALLIAVNSIAPTQVNAQSAAIIRVATDATFPPFEFSKDGKRTGFDIEWIETLANEGMTMLVVTHEMGFARELNGCC